MTSPTGVVLYVLRRDLRVRDNPPFHHLATTRSHGFTHLLPVYVLPADQMELSGLLADGAESPFPEARSQVGKYWRCGPHRAAFIAEAIQDVKATLESLSSGLLIRAGMVADVARTLVHGLKSNSLPVTAIWMTSHEGSEEKRAERLVKRLCKDLDIVFRLWGDEKYFIDNRDLGLESPQALPDVFTTYRKTKEPLRQRPRPVLPAPTANSLPPFPDLSKIPAQDGPFVIPDDAAALLEALLGPVRDFLANKPPFPDGAASAHPFKGGETEAQERLKALIKLGSMKNYKDTRNGLLGTEFSTKLSGYLAQGCLTARDIHHRLIAYEDGTDSEFAEAPGYGEGENEGTQAIRLELLWRDFMRLCHVKQGDGLFRLEGSKTNGAYAATGDVGEQGPNGAGAGEDGDDKKLREHKAAGRQPEVKWKTPDASKALPGQNPDPARIGHVLQRFVTGTTGMGLIDASQRELMHTGYTSNRARQNVASFLSKHLGIDWRYGAEWYEMLLVDYDVSSNWANWQYVSGVGNDPRELRIFNPVKQAFDYDSKGQYVRSWVPEVRKLDKLENVFQACTTSEQELLLREELAGNPMVTDPVMRIEFSVECKPTKPNKRKFFIRRRGSERAAERNKSPSAESPVSPAPGPPDVGSSESARSEGHAARGRGNSRGRGSRGGRGSRSFWNDSPRPAHEDPNGHRGGPFGNRGHFGYHRGAHRRAQQNQGHGQQQHVLSWSQPTASHVA